MITSLVMGLGDIKLMKIERKQNAARNMLVGTALNLYQILVPFFLRTALIYYLGIEYAGLNGLFTSVLQVLNVAELGVASAMIYSMYRPIAEDDTDTICKLLGLYRLYYRVIGLFIACVGVALTPFIPQLVKNDMPADMNIYVLYLINLAATVVSYWLFAYKSSLFQAHQRNDIMSGLTVIVSAAFHVLQFVSLIAFRNYYYFIVLTFFSRAVLNLAIAWMAGKYYPQYEPVGKLGKDSVRSINSRIKDLFINRISGVLGDSTDAIIISAFLGLTVLGMYQNYYYIFTAVTAFFSIFYDSIRAGIGNSLIVENQEKNFDDFKQLSLISSWVACVCACIMVGMFQPFIRLWVGESLMLSEGVAILLSIFFYVFNFIRVFSTTKDAAGIWHQDRWRPMVGGIINFALNLLTVRYWGIYGVLGATVLVYVIVYFPWLLYTVLLFVYRKSLREYLPFFFILLATAAVSFGICCVAIAHFDDTGVEMLMMRGALCFLLASLVHAFALWRLRETKQVLQKLKSIIIE